MGYTRTAPGSTKVARARIPETEHGAGADADHGLDLPQTHARDSTRILMPTPKHRLRLAGNPLTRVPGLGPGGFVSDPELTEDLVGTGTKKHQDGI